MPFNSHQNPEENTTIIFMLTMWEQVERNCNHIMIRSYQMKSPIFSHVWWKCQLHMVQLCVIYCRIGFKIKSELMVTKLLWVTNETCVKQPKYQIKYCPSDWCTVTLTKCSFCVCINFILPVILIPWGRQCTDVWTDVASETGRKSVAID